MTPDKIPIYTEGGSKPPYSNAVAGFILVLFILVNVIQCGTHEKHPKTNEGHTPSSQPR